MDSLIFKNINKDLEQVINDCLEGKELVITKWGNAKINNYGYYQITSGKEYNRGKYLHRLVWEDYYGKPVPEGYDIHHINKKPLDNRIQNLQCIEHSKHISFHSSNISDETRQKMSEKKKGENHPFFGKKRPKHSKRMTGENNPNAKYTLWDISTVRYLKGDMFNGGREPNPCKCFGVKYKDYTLPIGGFHDFVSCEIINDLIEKAIK